MSLGLRFICAFSVAIHCLSTLVLQTLSCPTFTESILFVLCLNGIFQRLTSWVISLRLPSIQEDRWKWGRRLTEVWTGKRGWEDLVRENCTLSKTCKHRNENTDQGKVQLGPNDVHSSFSSLFRWPWRNETAPAVIAGLATDAPNAGPPVVFTICERMCEHSQYHKEINY